MKLAHGLSVLMAAGTVCSAALANDPTAPTTSLPHAANPARVLRVTNLRTGQEIPQTHVAPRGTVTGFDNMHLPGSSAGLNVAYLNPGSYNGSNPSTTASIFGLGNPTGVQLAAPSLPAQGIPNATDIVWNEFTGDPAIWPNGAGMNANGVEFDIVTVRVNQTATPRVDTMNVLFFSADGTTFIGGFGVDIDTPANFAAYQEVDIDLTGATPPIPIPQDGIVMIDYLPLAGQTGIAGVGLALAGGDLANTAFPDPTTLVQVGTNDPTSWAFADHVTGDADHPMGPDPMFDMMDGLSYLDILNTGQLIDWQFTGTNPTRTFAHDFPIAIQVTAGIPGGTGACVTLDPLDCIITDETSCSIIGGTFLGGGTTCGGGQGACTVNGQCMIVPSEAICTVLAGTYGGEGSNCNAPTCPCNFNGDAFLNSQDFFDFLSCFFTPGCPNSDYNHDGFSNSQDFFDFLVCFFQPPQGCP